MRSLQKSAAVHASDANLNQERSLTSQDIFKLNRTAALAGRRVLLAA
jgi:putative transposase